MENQQFANTDALDMVPLESPRWLKLQHAYGSAVDVPDLIRSIQTELTPDYRDGGTWFEVYSSLFHQGSTYSATYAALPHIVRIAEVGTIRQRAAILCLVGEILIQGKADEAIPVDLLPDFEAAVAKVRGFSLQVVREAGGAKIFDSTGRHLSLGDALDAFGALYHPSSGYVGQLSFMVREGLRVEAQCPCCGETMSAKLGEEGIATMRIHNRGNTDASSARLSNVDRSGYEKLILNGHAILARNCAKWEIDDTASVLAALAEECADRLLALRILDLGTFVTCAYCQEGFELSKALGKM